MNLKPLLYYCVTVIFLLLIISHFTSLQIAQVVTGLIIVAGVSVYGYFSLRKNITILRKFGIYMDLPQNLIINGITIPLSVRTIALLKIIIWIMWYISIITIGNEIWDNWSKNH